ncbi:MAG: hypothetical protein IPJ84_07720 [Bdellovibrionales bacterium]|nr:hypothetical protein [Bdellovibrionales bacterium]
MEVTVGRTPIVRPNHIRELRAAHSGTHVFVRRGSDILDIPIASDSAVLGKAEKLSLQTDLGVTTDLIKEGLIRHLVGGGRILIGFDPICFLSEAPGDNFLAASFPAELACPSWLAVVAKPEISVRTIWVNPKTQIVAMIFNLWSTNVLSMNCRQLMDIGIPLEGKYISVRKDSEVSRFRERYEVIGRVARIDGANIILGDAKYPDRTVVRSEDAYIKPRIENLEACIDVVTKNNADGIKRNLRAKLSEFRSGPGRFSKIQIHASYFSKQKIEILPGVTVSAGPLIKQGESRLFPKIETLPRPTFIFDPTRQKTHTLHDRGLDEHGPYDQATFSVRTPRVAIICQASKKGRVEQFLRNFWDGMPTVATKKGVAPYSKGFLRKYVTNPWEVEFFVADTSTADAYNKAVQQALERAGTSGRKWNFAMVQIEENFRALPAALNPYLTTKASFLAQGIPSQDFNIETITKAGTQLAYSLNQMALATYAKLGGIPWLLSATPGVAHELIFGLGSANVGGGRFGAQEKVVGITTVFKGDGDYVLENRSKAVSFEDYPEQILSSLRSTIDLLKQRYNWQSGDSIRLIFHAFKPLKNIEVDAVKTLMEEIAKISALSTHSSTWSKIIPICFVMTRRLGLEILNPERLKV